MISAAGIVVISVNDLIALLDERFLQLQQCITLTTQETRLQSVDELMTRQEAKEFLKISYPTLNKWTKEKVINSKKIKRRVYYSRKQLTNFLSNKKTKTFLD